mmetsp:Transcript_97946/g.280186  ORF Transcript_97946/g.280186 Transcript_97946/m.280186 type:complete len:305 (+) Transcript_97946:23-937(+)
MNRLRGLSLSSHTPENLKRPTAEHIVSVLGHAVARELRPALGSDLEFALVACSVDHSATEASEARVKALQDAWLDAQRDAQGNTEAAPADEIGVLGRGGIGNAIRRWRCLLWRAWKLQGATPGLIMIRAFANLFTACIFGTIFHALPPTRASTLGRKGLCMVVVNYAAMTSMIKTLKVFRTETVLVERERAQELYTVSVRRSASASPLRSIANIYPTTPCMYYKGGLVLLCEGACRVTARGWPHGADGRYHLLSFAPRASRRVSPTSTVPGLHEPPRAAMASRLDHGGGAGSHAPERRHGVGDW